jgi:hypothetical protein
VAKWVFAAWKPEGTFYGWKVSEEQDVESLPSGGCTDENLLLLLLCMFLLTNLIACGSTEEMSGAREILADAELQHALCSAHCRNFRLTAKDYPVRY